MARKVEILPATAGHIPAIVANLREEDRIELSHYRISPTATLVTSLDASEKAWTGLIDGEPVCMFGLGRGEFLLGEMRPWLVGTVAMEKHAVTFLRKCKGVVAEMLDISPSLGNYVWEGNRRSMQWLKWLGFSIGDELVLPHAKFYRFEMKKEG